jgi:hypothetical protein
MAIFLGFFCFHKPLTREDLFMSSAGGLYINNSAAAVVVGAAAAKLNLTFSAMGSQHGDLTVYEDTTNKRLRLLPGRYLVQASLTVETEDISGTSGDDAGDLTFELYKDGVATGFKQKVNVQDSDRPQSLTIVGIIEVAAGANGYLELYGSASDASGNDVTVRNLQMTALHLN